MLLIGNGRLVTWNPEAPFLEDGCVAVSGDSIADFGATAEMREIYADADFYDAAGRVIMPGLINAHTHMHFSFARGLNLPQAQPGRGTVDLWEDRRRRITMALNERDSLYSAYAAGLESVRNGVTTIFDHHASPQHASGSLFAVADALSKIGLRAGLCYGVSGRDGEEAVRQAIDENVAFIEHTQQNGGGMLKGMFGLDADCALDDKTLERCAAAPAGQDAGYHVHAAGLQDSPEKHGGRLVQRLHSAGILGEKTLIVHSMHLGADEMDILKTTGAMAVHSPSSGTPGGAIPQMLGKGLLVGLGTDACPQDMFESLRAACGLGGNPVHGQQPCSPGAGYVESMEMLFRGNAAICGRFFKKPLGIVQRGACADLIVVDYAPHTPLNADTLAGHILLGMAGRGVDSALINGRFVMKERKIQTLDEEEILAGCRAQSADFWRRVQ